MKTLLDDIDALVKQRDQLRHALKALLAALDQEPGRTEWWLKAVRDNARAVSLPDEPPSVVAQITRLQRERDDLLATLKRIAKWTGEFPPSERTWPDGSAMSYNAAFGSNGERDYMRELAAAAIARAETEAK